MNKEWIEESLLLNEYNIEELEKKITKTIEKSKEFSNEERDYCLSLLHKDSLLKIYYVILKKAYYENNKDIKTNLREIADDIRELKKCKELNKDDLEKYLDPQPHCFIGDVIITDPVYFLKPEDRKAIDDPSKLKELGFSNFMMSDSFIHKADFSVRKDENGSSVDKVHVSSDNIGIFNFKDIVDYNENFISSMIYHDWTAILISDFNGTMEMHIYEDESKEKGFFLEITGKGFNTYSGAKINIQSL